jgi:hypothetical protein
VGGPCGDPTAIVNGVWVLLNRETSGVGGGMMEYGRGRRGGELRSGSDGRVVGLIGAIAGAEVLAHLWEGESALGNVGRAETTAGVALYETLGEEEVCHAFSPDLDVLLGLQGGGRGG